MILPLAVALVYLLMPDLKGASNRHEAIGTIKRKTNDVRYHEAGGSEWGPASPDQPVRRFAKLMTGERSTATVDLGDQGILEVGPNSLVVFSGDAQSGWSDFITGSFNLKVKKATAIAIQGQHVDLGGGLPEKHFSRMKNGRTAQVSVTIDEPSASPPEPASKPETTVVRWKLYDLYQEKNGQLVETGKFALPRENVRYELLDGPPPQLASPGETLAKPGSETTLAAYSAFQPLGYVIQTSESQDFPQGSRAVHWNPGAIVKVRAAKAVSLFYRVRAVNVNQELSDWSAPVALTWVAPEPPRALAPADDRVFTRETPSEKLPVKLELPRLAVAAVCEIFSREDLSRPLFSATVRGATETSLPDGSYLMRSKSLYAEGAVSGWSAPQIFEIKTRRQLETLKITRRKPLPPAPRDIAIERPERAPAAEETAESPPPALAAPEAFSASKVLTREAPEAIHPWTVEAGAGMSYVQFAQAGSQVSGLNYASVHSPSFAIGAGYGWTPRFDLWGNWARFPGEIRSEKASVQNPAFNWETLGLEGIYKTPTGSGREIDFRAGVSRHTLPYIQVTNVNVAEVRSMQIDMLTLGAGYKWETGTRLRPEIFMRYNFPFEQSERNGDDLTLKNKFAFDGSIGARYVLSPRLHLKFSWYGQWQEYTYRMQNVLNQSVDEGSNKFFFSNMELGLGCIY